MPPERPRPDFEQVREALRERDERTEEADAPPPPREEEGERRDDEDDDSASGDG